MSKRNDNNTWRYLLTAPDPDTVDEWWRKVSETKEDFHRLSPDFYSYTDGYPYQVAPEFEHRLIFSVVNNRDASQPSPIAHHQRTDLVSGDTTGNTLTKPQSFYVRSKSCPDLHWWAYSGRIYVSRRGRTRFRFRIEGDDGSKGEKIMIGDDRIIISSATDSQEMVGLDNSGELVLGGHSCGMYFKDLKRNLLASGEIDQAVVTKIDGAGEEWELVS
ncbi:hypothetical protein HJFPF1_06179 [Paramyrothecium foliicola]|nr:hypothetical protein HJFPF1_06179 [Paramyrothecium foliicola]